MAPRTLAKRLRERGFLCSTDQNNGELKIRKTLEGRRHDVLHLAASIVPQPDFAPFVVKRAMDERLPGANTNGATEVTPSSEVMNGRKRRGSVSSPRRDSTGTEPIEIAVVPPRRVAEKSKRAAPQSPRQAKLTPSDKATIRAIGNNRRLRGLAAEFGVNHETIRAVLRELAPAAIG